MDALNVVLPLVSVLVGSGIAYWINIRTRRRTYVEDSFNRAIAAVAAAEASVHYLTGVERPAHLSDAQFDELLQWFVLEGMKNWATKTGQANEAVTQVVPFQPELAEHLPYRPAVDSDVGIELIAELRRGVQSR